MRELCRAWGLGNDLSPVQDLLQNTLSCALARHQPMVFVCLGTDKVLGDCFGAVVGDLLLSLHLPTHIYGSTRNNVDAHNVRQTLEVVEALHPGSLVVVVDALSTTDSSTIGDVILSDQYIGLNARVEVTADLFVYGVTTYLSPTRHNLYARLGVVNRLAHNLAHTIASAIHNATHKNSIAFLERCLG